jgi:hypothetical protein
MKDYSNLILSTGFDGPVKLHKDNGELIAKYIGHSKGSKDIQISNDS